jgi:hypothetical protein
MLANSLSYTYDHLWFGQLQCRQPTDRAAFEARPGANTILSLSQ